MAILHPTEPHPSLASARFWSIAVFLTVLLATGVVLLQLFPPVIWSHRADTDVAFYLSDLHFFLEHFVAPPPDSMSIGNLVVYPFQLLAALAHMLPSSKLVLPLVLRIGVAIVVALAAAKPVFKRVRDASPKFIAARHVSGPRPMRGRWGETHLNQRWEPLRRQTGDGLLLAPRIRLPINTEKEGLLLVGPPGSGKSVILESLLMQSLARKDRVVALDVKGGLGKRIAKYHPRIFDLSGQTSVVWAIGQDLIDDADADEFAASLIPESRDPVWSEGSRLILSALVLHLGKRHGRRWGWGHLYKMLTRPVEKIEAIVRKIAPEVANMIQTRGEEPATFVLSLLFNLISHVGATARRFARMESAGARRVSLRAWATAMTARSPIILRYDLQRRDRSASFVRLALRLLAGALLGDQLQDGVDSHTWLFLDEGTRIGRTDALIDLVSLGRSRGVRSVFSVQSPAQLRDVYNEAGAEAFRENFGLQIICGLPPGDNARRVANEWIGPRTVCEATALAKDGNPREWTIPPISASEYAADFGLRFNLWGQPYIRAAVLGLGDVPVVDWPIKGRRGAG